MINILALTEGRRIKEETPERHRCVICKTMFRGFGNNPAPLKKRGRCCNGCNKDVIATRLKQMVIK